MKIIVTWEDLQRKMEQTNKGDLLELCIVPSQVDGLESNPAFLHIASIHNGCYSDLESIDAYSTDAVIKTA
ncbi:hypothetical protein [Clostridium minihomine]|uniref:hypothetical protein n=1 Tax=Clostridium minihomine TaxID=2045012 RepID=UPI0013E9BB77|nr:hypothetical protein [Clostridium minihomine]